MSLRANESGPGRDGTRLSAADLEIWRRLRPSDPAPERPTRRSRPRARPLSERVTPAPPLSSFRPEPPAPRPEPPAPIRPRRAASHARRREIIRVIQAVGIHRAFCDDWKRLRYCPECYQLLDLANEARARMGLGPRPDPPWVARVRRSVAGGHGDRGVAGAGTGGESGNVGA